MTKYWATSWIKTELEICIEWAWCWTDYWYRWTTQLCRWGLSPDFFFICGL